MIKINILIIDQDDLNFSFLFTFKHRYKKNEVHGTVMCTLWERYAGGDMHINKEISS